MVATRNWIGCMTLALMGLGATFGAWSSEVRVGGGAASLNAIFEPVKPHFEKATGIALVNLESSSKGGLVNLIAGKIDVVVSSHSLDSAIAGLAKEGMGVDASALVVTEIGINRTVLLVHPGNSGGKFSKGQVKEVFTGRVANWKDVGGDDREIVVVWGKGTQGQNAEFAKAFLDGEGVTRDALATFGYADIRDAVSATPEAIGIAPASFAVHTVRAIDLDPPLASPIIAVTLGKPSARVQRLLDYVRGEGRFHVRA